MYRNSPDRSTKSTPSGLNALRLLVNTGFQVLFHSPLGVLFTFPSRYCFTIGHRLVFSLGWWSTLLPTRFPVPRGTPDLGRNVENFAYGALTLCGRGFPSPLPLVFFVPCAGPLPRTPRRAPGLGFSAFARHYLRNHFCFLFLRVLRCFSSPRFPRSSLFYSARARPGIHPGRVPPFGHPRIAGYVRLPAAFRSLSRPSSASGAKAFALCSL